jgi:hypothetical protein
MIKKVDVVDMVAKCALSSVLNSNTNRFVKCTNCVQMKRQLDDVLLQLKSLQKIIELLQQDNGDSRILNHEDTADKCVIVNEDLDLFCDAKHRGNCNVLPVTVALPSSLPVLDSKFIAQADSLSK